MSKHGSITECKSVPGGLLKPDEMRKFNHHVQRNRGELLFARCWLLIEGETDVSVFSECAKLLELDLPGHGVRIVEYSQAGGPGIFIKVADALGISWYMVADNDEGGKKYIKAVRNLLNDREETDHISVLPFPNIDILLCCSGYGEPYRKGVGPQKVGDLTFPEGTIEYWEQVYEIVNKTRGFSKPAAALSSLMLMKESDGVPDELKDILHKVIALAGGGP